MIEQVAEAFKQKDYRTASTLLKQLVKEQPQNPWVHLYIGRLREEGGNLEAAETTYRQLLRGCVNPKIVSQARQGLKRLEDIEQQKRQKALELATADPQTSELGVLVLEAVQPEDKQVAAQKFAKILNIDPYTARLKLPSRGWRLYRVGAVGELQFYTQQLREAEVPSFVAAIANLDKIKVYNVNYFESVNSQNTVVCQDQLGQTGSFTFDWAEVKQRVLGQLPIFEEVVDVDSRRKLQRKTKILDYVDFCDLHLPDRGSILRLSDRNYQFKQGIPLVTAEQSDRLAQATSRKNWDNVLNLLKQPLHQTVDWSDFTPFAETALDQTELLKRIKSHIDLFRRKETLWDPAFELYSGLIFLKFQQHSGYSP